MHINLHNKHIHLNHVKDLVYNKIVLIFSFIAQYYIDYWYHWDLTLSSSLPKERDSVSPALTPPNLYTLLKQMSLQRFHANTTVKAITIDMNTAFPILSCSVKHINGWVRPAILWHYFSLTKTVFYTLNTQL